MAAESGRAFLSRAPAAEKAGMTGCATEGRRRAGPVARGVAVLVLGGVAECGRREGGLSGNAGVLGGGPGCQGATTRGQPDKSYRAPLSREVLLPRTYAHDPGAGRVVTMPMNDPRHLSRVGIEQMPGPAGRPADLRRSVLRAESPGPGGAFPRRPLEACQAPNAPRRSGRGRGAPVRRMNSAAASPAGVRGRSAPRARGDGARRGRRETARTAGRDR